MVQLFAPITTSVSAALTCFVKVQMSEAGYAVFLRAERRRMIREKENGKEVVRCVPSHISVGVPDDLRFVFVLLSFCTI